MPDLPGMAESSTDYKTSLKNNSVEFAVLMSSVCVLSDRSSPPLQRANVQMASSRGNNGGEGLGGCSAAHSRAAL